MHLELGNHLGVDAFSLDRHDGRKSLRSNHYSCRVDGILSAKSLNPRAASTISRTPGSPSYSSRKPRALEYQSLISEAAPERGGVRTWSSVGSLPRIEGASTWRSDRPLHKDGPELEPRPYRLFTLDGRKGDDLGYPIFAIFLCGISDHLAPVAVVEVHIDIGHRLAPGVEESLENQTVRKWVDIGDS